MSQENNITKHADSPTNTNMKQRRPSKLGIIEDKKLPESTFGKHVKSTAFSSFRDSTKDEVGMHARQLSTGSTGSIDRLGGTLDFNVVTPSVAITPAEEFTPSLPNQNYDDYWREFQNIQEESPESGVEEEKITNGRQSESNNDDMDEEADWLRLAGLSDLVHSSRSEPEELLKSPSKESSDGRESVSSMTVLSTLTRPQREAVLRRITSFNKSQVTKQKRVIPSIQTLFSHNENDEEDSDEEVQSYPPRPSSVEKQRKEVKKTKSNSLPRTLPVYDSTTYPRRYSEITSFSRTSKANSKLEQNLKKNNSASSEVALHDNGIETLKFTSRHQDVEWTGFTNDKNKGTKIVNFSETEHKENLPNYENLPQYAPQRDSLGITRINDLSLVDMKRIQSLALIELTALFDDYSIELKRRKSGKNKAKDSCVFGNSLTYLLEADIKRTANANLRVPLVFTEIIRFLTAESSIKVEGILRKSGSANRIKLLRQDLENRFGFSLSYDNIIPSSTWTSSYPHDVATLLKQFLRELPDPLLSNNHIEAFQSVEMIKNREKQLQALNLLIILLDEVHRDTLQTLLIFLSKVVANEESNKMSLNNVAMITAPNLFLSKKIKDNKNPSSASEDIKYAAGTSNIVRMLIKYHKLLWTLPPFMVTQVRLMNNAQVNVRIPSLTNHKYKVPKFFPSNKGHKKTQSFSPAHVPSQPAQPFELDTPAGLLRVQVSVPDVESITSMAVQMDMNLTAGDVIDRFQRQVERRNRNGSIPLINNTTHALFEIGGNIHERQLHPDTDITKLSIVNPQAVWIIKTRTEIS